MAMWQIAKDSWEKVAALGLATGGDAATALGLVTGGDAATALGLVTGGDAVTASGLVTVVTVVCSTTWLRKQATAPDTVNARASHVSGGGVEDGDWATLDMLLWLTG